MFETILYEVKNHVAWVTLNRPDKLNALTDQMNHELTQAFKKCQKDDEVRTVVITGAGRAFCSGADLAGVHEGMDHGELLRKRYNPMINALANLEKPVIAAVNGVAAGAGMSLALACDFRIASEKASFIAAFIHVGLVPDSGMLYYLPRIVGYAKALEWSVLGEKISVDEAKAEDLINRVSPLDSFENDVQDFADRLAAMPTKAIGLMKRYMQKSYETTLEGMLENEALAQRTAGLTKDHREGVSAFLEKRKPVYQGQ